MDKKLRSINYSEFYKKYGIAIILVVMALASSIISPTFATQANITNVIRQLSVIMIIACGAQLVMLCGMIDLSPGAVLALAGVIAVDVYVKTQSIFLALVVAVGIGTVCGTIMGFVITKFNLMPFIMTLAMTNVARGLALIYTDGKTIPGLKDLTVLGQGYVGPIPVPIIIMLGCVCIVWVILNKTKFGRYIYAVGGNEAASRACGIDVKAIKLQAFVIDGAFVGLAGLILMARVNSGQPAIGNGYEFDAITAIIVGGTSMTGGAGSILGTLVGGLIVMIINNMLNLMSVSAYVQQVVKGVIIAIAVIVDIMTKSDNNKPLKKII